MADLPPWLEAQGTSHLATLIDHTLLGPEASAADIKRLCQEARLHRLGAVCVNPQWVGLAAQMVRDDPAPIRVVAVIGFPLGATGLANKVAEATAAVAAGATELDLVLALGWVRSNRWDAVREEITGVVTAAGGAGVKVILETAALSAAEIELGCQAAQDGGASFVKTSTGYHPAGGATVEAVSQMRGVVGPAFGVKASGGIRSADAALRLLAAGANRIGSSAAAGWGGVLATPLSNLWS